MSEESGKAPAGRVGAPVRTQDPAGDPATLKDRSRPGRRAYSFPSLDVPEATVPPEHARSERAGLPEVAERDLVPGQQRGRLPRHQVLRDTLPDQHRAVGRASVHHDQYAVGRNLELGVGLGERHVLRPERDDVPRLLARSRLGTTTAERPPGRRSRSTS